MLSVDLTLPRKGLELRFIAGFGRGITGIVGPSGAGKTSLLRCIAGLERHARGKVQLAGSMLLHSDHGVNVPVHKRKISLCFQNDRLFPHFSVERNLRYGIRCKAGTDPLVTYEEIVERLGLQALLARRVRDISGGEARCVALGRALLAKPQLLLLDEPFTGLDAKRCRDALSLLRDIHSREDLPMLVVSHDMESVLTLTDQLAVVEGGRLLDSGNLAELLHRPAIARRLHAGGLVNMLRMRVAWNDAARGVSLCHPAINAMGQPGAPQRDRLPVIRVPLLDRPAGAEVRVSLRPEDILLARRPIPGVSIQNQLSGRVVSITPHATRSLCLIDVGTTILADVPCDTVREMKLQVGAPLWCLFKTEHLRAA